MGPIKEDGSYLKYHRKHQKKTMQDVESYGLVGNEKKQTMLHQRLIAYLAILLVMLAFIFSCIGLNMGRQSNLEKTLYTFSFPYFNQVPKVEPGMVVSLDTKGYVFTGAGTTISRNVTVEPSYVHSDIRVTAWGQNFVIMGARSHLLAYDITYDDIVIKNYDIELPKVEGKEREVAALFRLSEDTLAVVGSGEIIPYTITIEKTGDKQYELKYQVGTPQRFGDPETSYPYCDDLRDDKEQRMLACTYEDGINLVTRLFTLRSEGSAKTFAMSKPVVYGLRRKFHGLAGLGPEGYVVAAVGPLYNETHQMGPILVAYARIENGEVYVHDFERLPFEMSYGYFSLDNLYRNGAVMCYTRAASGGIDCVSMDVTHGAPGPHHRNIQWGSTLTVSTGGSSILYSKVKLQIINRDTFALMYSDQNIGGAVAYQMVTFNNAGDMVKNGPAYIISHWNRSHKVLEHIIGCTGVDFYKSALVEIVQSDKGGYAYLHTVYVYPRPIGIAAKNIAGGNQVQFGGLWKVKSDVLKKLKQGKLIPGWMYYTNDRGMILPGGPAGYMHWDFGVFYVRSRDDDSLLSLRNQIGMAISENEILIRMN